MSILFVFIKGVLTGYQDRDVQAAAKDHSNRIDRGGCSFNGSAEQAESAAEMSTKLNFKDADVLARKDPWAVGYVAVALEKNLFNETDTLVQPEKPATRLFAARCS